MSFKITAAVSSIKAAKELATAISAISKDVAVNDKAIELQNFILSIQTDMLVMQEKVGELLDSKRNLEQKLVELENWEKTKSQYNFTEISKGSFVYAPVLTQQSGEPMHWLCANCFKSKNETILQREWERSSEDKYACPRCKSSIQVQHPPSDQPHYFPRNSDHWGSGAYL